MAASGSGYASRVGARWAARRRRDRRWRVLTTLATLAALAGLLGLIAYYWVPGSVFTLGLAAGATYLMLGALVGAVLFAVARGVTGWVGLGGTLVLLAWAVLVRAPLFVSASVPPGRDVVVMTANLRLGTADARSVVDAVRTHHVDVLMLEELPPEETARLRAAGLFRLLPYQQIVVGQTSYGTGLLSRWPLRDARNEYDFGFGFVRARVEVPGTNAAPTMVALHMFGPYPGRQTPGWVKDMEHLGPVLQEMPHDAPVVVGGDFNATTDVARFRALLTGGYTDGTEQAGAGLVPTYPANRWFPPLLAIDHVLTRAAVAHTADSVSIAGSDHRALLVTVRLPG